jgi:hypothetical protein
VEEYCETDREVKKMIRNAKRKFEKRLADDKSGNSRPFYAYVKKKTKSRTAIGPLLDSEKKSITGEKEMADLLNGFFSSVFTREDLTSIPTATKRGEETFEKVEITAKGIKAKIRNLKSFSAAGPDGIGPQLLQELQHELTPALVQIYRQSLRCGEVPEDWKLANVTPIFKKGKRSDPGNYRPVSLTSVCCRILESIIRDSMMDHLVKNNC